MCYTKLLGFVSWYFIRLSYGTLLLVLLYIFVPIASFYRTIIISLPTGDSSLFSIFTNKEHSPPHFIGHFPHSLFKKHFQYGLSKF